MRRNEKKQRRKLLSRVMALVAAITLTAVSVGTTMPVQAANTPVNGGTTTFNKYLTMDEEANVPNVTFGFNITAGQSVAASETNPAIYAGIGSPTVEEAVFKAGDATIKGKPSDAAGTPTEGFKYATDEVIVDFSNVSFTNPGIYRYIITEKESTASGIKNDSTNTRTLDVYVTYEDGSDEQLVVKGYAMYNGTVTTNENLDTNKSEDFTNTYATYNLDLTKNVTGNQGDRDKYFRFEVTISGAVNGTVYDVDLPDYADLEDSDMVPGDVIGNVNSSKLTATEGSVTAVYYLKNDQTMTINGLTEDTTYSITEYSYSGDGYTTTYVIDNAGKTTSNTTGNQQIIANDSQNNVIFENDKGGMVPTGILLETAPYIVLAAVVLAGLAVLFVTRRRRAR